MKRFWINIGVVVAVMVLLSIIAHIWVVRWDMTDDQRYSLSRSTKQLLKGIDGSIELTCYMDGKTSADYGHLLQATHEIVDDMNRLGAHMKWQNYDAESDQYAQVMAQNLPAERITLKGSDGRTIETTIFPYVKLSYQGKEAWINLRKDHMSRQDKESFNACIEGLETQFASALLQLTEDMSRRVLFVTGHQELPEINTRSLTDALEALDYHIDHGEIGNDPRLLTSYNALVIAAPQAAYSELDKYVLDQYVQQGGNVLWVLDGVILREEMLSEVGYTPAVALNVNLNDILFRYGVRIDPGIVQDRQCLPMPVNMSDDPQEPNFQEIPWYYSPILLASQYSPITKDISNVMCSFASPVDIVGGEDGLKKDVLLATSSASRYIKAPAKVEAEINPDPESFIYQYIPVAVSMEGQFPSIFAYRLAPEGVANDYQPTEQSKKSKQVVIGSSSIISNDVYKGQPLPLGLDRYTSQQFGNADLMVNVMHYLCCDEREMSIRHERSVALRLLNDERAYGEKKRIQWISTITPILILLLAGIIILLVRKRKYSRK